MKLPRRNFGHQLMQEPQPLGCDLLGEIVDAGGVAARALVRLDEAESEVRVLVATSDRHRLPRIKCSQVPNPFSFYSIAHAAGRNSTPSGTSPVVARRHSAISSLRASATIIVVLRAPLGPSVRVRYHRASALSLLRKSSTMSG